MDYLNKEELSRYYQLIALMGFYESSKNDQERNQILVKINLIADVSEFTANEYYPSSNLEEFCISLAVLRENGNTLEKATARDIVIKIFNTNGLEEREYLICKYSDAIEFIYRKNTGYLVNCLYHKDISLEELLVMFEDDLDGPIQL